MTSNIDVRLGRGKEGITIGKSFVYVGTICRQDKRLGRARLGGVRIWSLYPPHATERLSTTISEPGTGYSGPHTVFQKKKE